MRSLVVALCVATTGVLAAGCSSAPTTTTTALCSTRGKCANEPAPTQADIDSCNAAMNASCGAKFKAFFQCALNNEVCTAEGGFDLTATELQCPTEFGALLSCHGTGPDGGDDGASDAGSDGGPSDAGKSCGPSTCVGCCFNNVCQTGTTAAGCGKSGATCAVCTALKICKADQTCGVDPERFWQVQPVSATIGNTNNGADWDFGGGAPDPFVDLWCPETAASVTNRTPTVVDSFFPTWSTGGCLMKAKDLMAAGYGIQVWDEDVASNDAISGYGKITVSESALLTGFQNLSAGTTLVTMKVAYLPQ